MSRTNASLGANVKWPAPLSASNWPSNAIVPAGARSVNFAAPSAAVSPSSRDSLSVTPDMLFPQ